MQTANKIVHTSAQGTFKRLSNYSEGENVISAGHSDYGIAVPAEHSAISLSLVSVVFLNLYPDSDNLINAKVLHEWVDVIQDAYYGAEEQCFHDDNEHRAKRVDGSAIHVEEI